MQEVYETNPAIREACEASILGHAAKLEADVAAAIELHRTPSGVMARSLALHMQAVLQGAFILAKAKGDAAVTAESIDHLARASKSDTELTLKLREEVERKTKAAAVKAAETVGRQKGLTADTIAAIKSQILGVKAA